MAKRMANLHLTAQEWVTAALAATLLWPLSAQALDQYDQGEYVALRQDGSPGELRMRYFLRGTQWMMDGKTGKENWQPVCRNAGGCRLTDADGKSLARYRALLPADKRAYPLSCIQNMAFAFCRSHQPERPSVRMYWWVVTATAKPVVVPLNPVR